MGLAAGQARLLTITARKADCEYSSMGLSHQKIALSRDMNKISEQYQNATNKTKLVYDYYGKNDQSTPLSYGLLMKPSKLNNYIPSPITDASGKVVLDDKLAKAARAAGIPQEGLGGLPSSDARNKFIDSLAATGEINQTVADQIKQVKYNQTSGVGSTDIIKIQTEEGTLSDIIQKLSSSYYDFGDLIGNKGGSDLGLYTNTAAGGSYQATSSSNTKLSLGEILSGNYSIRGLTWDHEDLNGKDGLYNWSVTDKVGSSSFFDSMFEQFDKLLNTGDPYTQAAIEYAESKVGGMLECLSTPEDGLDSSNFGYMGNSQHSGQNKVMGNVNDETDKYLGHVYIKNKNNGGGYNDGYGMNISNIAKAYLTYFAQYMEGITNSDYKVEKKKADCNFVGEEFKFTLVKGAEISGDNVLIANFYDTLFNQICMNGWTENKNVTDNKYLQEMLQNGAMYISTLSDDGFYYQGNYATNTYIKEITDETAIAEAEANYTREKSKITYKENILDLKMKNLDTEISALTTEYDSVKNIISKNIEKAFKRFNA